MMRNIGWIILLLISPILYAQNVMQYVNGDLLKATDEWKFVNEDYAYGAFTFQIAKHQNGGILKVSAEVSDTNFIIGGNLYIDFKDATYIICTDKNQRAIDGNKAIAYYILTPKEIELLKRKTIANIRFRIVGNQTIFSSKTGHFTAYNFAEAFTKILQKEFLFESHLEVQELFKS